LPEILAGQYCEERRVRVHPLAAKAEAGAPTTHEEIDMDLQDLIKALGLADDATEDDVKDKIGELVAAKADQHPGGSLPKPLLDELGLPADADADAATEAIVALKAPNPSPSPTGGREGDGGAQSEIDALQKQVADLTAQAAHREAEAAVGAAIKACKLAPAQRDWAIGYAAREPDGFQAMIEAAPLLVAAKAQPPEGSQPGGSTADLTDEDREVAKMFGTDPKEFAETKAALAQ
jgi:phage I-like protein